MKPSGTERPLFAFIASLAFEDLHECTSWYFAHDREYVGAGQKSLSVFLQLTHQSIAKGDVYFALHTEVAVRAPGTSWEIHYTPLSSKDKAAVAAHIYGKKKAL